MLTWLDSWVREQAQQAREQFPLNRPRMTTDCMATAVRLINAYVALRRGWLKFGGEHTRLLTGDLTGEEAAMATAMARFQVMLPWVHAHPDIDPLAMQLSPELVADLAAAEPPESPEPGRLIAKHRAIYLDLPHGAMLLQGGQIEVRALFLTHLGYVFEVRDLPGHLGLHHMRLPDDWEGWGEEPYIVTAVLTRRGSDRLVEATLHWDWGSDGAFFGLGSDLFTAIAKEMGIDRAEKVLMGDIESFARLVLLYYGHLPPEVRPTVLPHIDQGRLERLTPDKQRAKTQKASMFRVLRLAGPADRFGRTGAPGGSWHLDHQIRVRGHFKMQPHGPGRRERKLIFVAPYHKGPREAPEQVRHPIVKL